ncbi:MAG: hypothetical protein MHM6MM_003771 [Cercozoa sp. M6MM]
MGAKQARKHAQKMTKLREGRSQRVSKRIDNTDRRSSQKSQRSTSAIRMERMRSQKLQRDRDGRVIGGAFQSSEAECGKVARVQPDRRWFENTRVIGQKQLTHFREEMAKQVQNDPYKVVLRRNLVPMGLLNAGKNEKEQVRTLLDRESYSDTFGDKARRKRPTLSVTSLDEMVAQAQQEALKYDASKDADHVKATTDDDGCGVVADPFMRAGQSNRIWSELYKVIDSSDVLIQVLDARDPQGTRCLHIERHLREREPHKHMVIVLNKCDLVPTWAVARWIKLHTVQGQEFRQRRSHCAATTVCDAAQGPSFGECGSHRVPQRGQEQRDQHAARQARVPHGTGAGRDQGVAVHHALPACLPDRLSRRRVRWYQGHARRHGAQGRRHGREGRRTGLVRRRHPASRQGARHHACLRHSGVGECRRLSGEVCTQARQARQGRRTRHQCRRTSAAG